MNFEFPDPHDADADGLVAIGGDLSIPRLLMAYRSGIFPWYSEGDPICWYSPDPRFVLFPENIKISSSMRTVLNNPRFRFRINTAFEEVITQCQSVGRKDQPGTWITDDMKDAYIDMHKAGYAFSAETWKGGKLIGGLYGVRFGKFFFGESMFSNESNASKYAFIRYVHQLQKEGVELIDCQVYTKHLESLGAGMISRDEFLERLQTHPI